MFGFFKRKFTFEDIVKVFRQCGHDTLNGLDKVGKNIYSNLYPGKILVDLVTQGSTESFLEIASKDNKTVQKYYFLACYIRSLGDLFLFNYLSKEASEPILCVMAISSQDKNINKILEYNLENNENLIKALRHHYLKEFLTKAFLMNGLKTTYETLFKVDIDESIEKNYKLMIEDHIKKLSWELWITEDPSNIPKELESIIEQYDFEQSSKRIEILDNYVTGVELNNIEKQTLALDQYPKLMEKNHAIYQKAFKS